MHERPSGFSDNALIAVLTEAWDVGVSGVDYLPVGFGGYHWAARTGDGERWFVTLSQVASDDAFADLAATMAAAAILADRPGLDFVIGPLLTPAKEATVRAQRGWAVTVTPFADGTPGHFGDNLTAADQAELTAMLAALHRADPPAGTPFRSPHLDSRPILELLIGERAGSWSAAGPYSAPARELVAGHAADLRRALAVFDDLVAQVDRTDVPVLTHGEPHPGNLIRRDGRYLLIDWDTAGLAPRERDLWRVLPDPETDPAGFAEAAGRYAALAGHEVSTAALALYRLRWDLDDISLFLADFRAPHEQTADTRVAWAGLQDAVRRIAGDG
ncbi:MAG TPA: aminoglycoside phosphotransferase family protein [Streptosporangiaceae bacterium]